MTLANISKRDLDGTEKLKLKHFPERNGGRPEVDAQGQSPFDMDPRGKTTIKLAVPTREQAWWSGQWNWFSYFFNALAARAFMNLDLAEISAVNSRRRQWVLDGLAAREVTT